MITIHKPTDEVSEKQLLRFASQARKAIGLKGDVSVLLTSSREMRQLNRCFRGKDKATDVISFPAVEAVRSKFAGDLAISMDIAAANAKHFGHSTQDEVCVLILHGLVHLAGYDHETDNGEMARKELRLRKQLGVKSNLIARTEAPIKTATVRQAAKARRSR